MLDTPAAWDKAIDKIYYFYGIPTESLQVITQKFPQATIMEGIPRNLDNPREIFDSNKNNVVIFDDLSDFTQNSPDMTTFMTKGTHHCNVSMISVEHFLFSNSRERRNQANHWHQLVLFRNKRAMQQIGVMARQMSISSPKTVQWAFKDATSTPYSYLVIDTRNDTAEEAQLLTNVLLENDSPTYVYV
ncbi:MAG: hypothetical protein GY804_04330 [Alphaproteobacteria bacterium]|nr:hypothetical protein [Alphaproteobacteria bacterium]